MKHLLSLASLTIIASSMTACTVKTGLPFATARVGAPTASVSETPSEGGIDEPSAYCEQELGRDAGGKVRSAHVLDDRKIKGCMVEGDKLDMYLVKVPADVSTLTYRLKVINHGETIGASIYTMEGERLARDGWITEGQAFRKALELEGGETYKVIIKNTHNNDHVSYTLRVKPSDTIAEN